MVHDEIPYSSSRNTADTNRDGRTFPAFRPRGRNGGSAGRSDRHRLSPGRRRLSLRIPAGPRVARFLPHRMVVLHRSPGDSGRPAIRIRAHVLPARDCPRTGRDAPVPLVGGSALSGPSGRYGCHRPTLSLSRPHQPRRTGQSRSRHHPPARLARSLARRIITAARPPASSFMLRMARTCRASFSSRSFCSSLA